MNGPTPNITALADRVRTGSRLAIVRIAADGSTSQPLALLGGDHETAVEAVLNEVLDLELELVEARTIMAAQKRSADQLQACVDSLREALGKPSELRMPLINGAFAVLRAAQRTRP